MSIKILSFDEFLFENQDSGELKIPGDPYTYKLVNGVWYTKGKTIKDWKSLANDKEAIDILNKQFASIVNKADYLPSFMKSAVIKSADGAAGSAYGALAGNKDPLTKATKRLTTPQTSPPPPNSGYIMVFAFPDYQPAVEDTWMNRNVLQPITSWIYDNEELAYYGFEVINEEEVKQGGSGDPYEYKKDGEKYYTRKKGSKGQWILLSGKFAEGVKTKIFGSSSSTSGGSSAGKSSAGGSGSGSGSGKMIKLGKLGHGGCIVIKKDGNATLYEFGRYKENNKGNVIKANLGKIAKIVNGKLTNPAQVAKIAKARTQGQGPSLAMDVVIKELPDPDKAIAFADVEVRDYTIADPGKGGAMNCGTYALEVAIEGGVDAEFVCFASPIQVVDSLEPGISLPGAPMGTLTV